MVKSIKQKAIEHYDRMIEWAKTRDSREHVDKQSNDAFPFSDVHGIDVMFYDLGETFGGKDCVYCRKYGDFCEECPLRKNDFCCDGLYLKMRESRTWGKWIKNAEKVRKYIEKNG